MKVSIFHSSISFRYWIQPQPTKLIPPLPTISIHCLTGLTAEVRTLEACVPAFEVPTGRHLWVTTTTTSMYLLCAPMSHAVQPATRITTIPDNPPNPFNPTNPSSDNELLAHHRRYQITFNVQTVAVRRPGSADFNSPGYTHGCLCFTRSYLDKPR